MQHQHRTATSIILVPSRRLVTVLKQPEARKVSQEALDAPLQELACSMQASPPHPPTSPLRESHFTAAQPSPTSLAQPPEIP